MEKHLWYEMITTDNHSLDEIVKNFWASVGHGLSTKSWFNGDYGYHFACSVDLPGLNHIEHVAHAFKGDDKYQNELNWRTEMFFNVFF